MLPAMPRVRATSATTSGKPTPPAPFTPGPDTRRARGPKKGAPNAGRPPEWFKQQVEAGLTRQQTIDALHRVLENENHPQFAAVLRWASERVYGKPEQPVSHSGTIGGVAIVPATMPAEQWAAVAAAQQTALRGQVAEAAAAAERAAGRKA
jgi:hypothetical protein